MEQDTEEINDLIKIKEEVQEILPTHENNESDCIASVIKEEINELIKIKEEVQEILPTHDFNESDCTVSDDKNVLYNLVKIKEELDPIAADDEKQIVKLVKEESSQEDSIEQITAKSQQSVSTWITSMNKAQILNELKKLGLETPRTIDECRTVLRNYMKSKLAKQKEQNESTQEDSIEQITAKPKQCVSNWIMSMNKVQIQNELRKLGLNTPRTVDECRSVLRNYMKNKSVNQKEQNFKVEDEEEEKCVLPLVPDIQQSLQPAEELILPDLLTPSSSSQNDFKINKSEHSLSGDDSASVSNMEVTKQRSFDGQLIPRLSICDQTNKNDDENLKIKSKGSRSNLIAPQKRITRSTTVYAKIPVNSKPVSSRQGLDVGRKQLNNSSPSNHLKSFSIVGNITKCDKNVCSVESPSICRKSTKVRNNYKLVKNRSKVPEVNRRLSNLSSNVNYGSGDSDESLNVSLMSNKVINKNAFRTYRTDFESNINVVRKHTRVYIFKCKSCDRKFDTKIKLKLHEESKCGPEKLFGCDTCGKGFFKRYHLMAHVNKDHLNSVKYNCDLCDKGYYSKHALFKHRNSHHLPKTLSNLLPLTCEYCQKICTSKGYIYNHVRRKHSSFEPERFECEHCTKVFTNRQSIVSHIRSKHLEIRVKCVYCNRCFSSEQNLQDHLKSNICRKKSVTCEQCGKVLSRKCKLSNHLLTHTDEKPYVCETCGKCFRTESNLAQHSLTHSNIRPFSCDICSKSFRIRNHLRQHMAVHGLVNTVVKRRQKNKKNNKGIKK